MIKFSCEKVLLQNAISVASRAVSPKSSIPALEGLLLRADQLLTVSGYNMQTGIRTKVEAAVAEGGEIVLNARLFGDIIRRMPDDVVTVSADDHLMVHLSCGDADFDILGLSAADYPDLPEVEDGYPDSLLEGEVIDLNTASAADLTRLPGIGEKRAQAIVDYRESSGPFQSVEELTEVKGIGEGILAQVYDYVTVGGPDSPAE